MKDCIFCKIIKNEIPAKILYENEKTICIMDVDPISDGHCILFPKKHFDFFSNCNDEYILDLMKTTKNIAMKINESKIKNNGINYLINEKEMAGQEIMHLHVHIIPKIEKESGLKISFNKKNKKTIEDNFNLIYSSIIR